MRQEYVEGSLPLPRRMETPNKSGAERRCSASFHLENDKRRRTAPFRPETSDSADLRKLDTEGHAPTTTCCFDVEGDTLTASDGGRCARFEDVTNNEDHAIVGSGEMSRPPDETSGVKSDESSRDAHTHSSALSPGSKQDAIQNAIHCLPEGTFELQASSTANIDRPWKNGNMYSHIQVQEEARVHLGDSYTVNNHYSGSITAAERHTVARVEVTEEFLMTLSAFIVLVRTLLQTTTGLFLLLQAAMSAHGLAKQISDETAMFEDALGRFQKIDLRFVDNWLVFRRRLECDFQGTPGSRRILKMKYRLFDRVSGNRLVDPRHPPPFASVFKHGRHVQMSIHFEWDEVSDKQCPRCNMTQECSAEAETICAWCKFSYRGKVEDARVEEVGNEDTSSLIENRDALNTAGPRSRPEGRDEPSSFSRITISKKPLEAIDLSWGCISIARKGRVRRPGQAVTCVTRPLSMTTSMTHWLTNERTVPSRPNETSEARYKPS
jgi:hypothetical protein